MRRFSLFSIFFYLSVLSVLFAGCESSSSTHVGSNPDSGADTDTDADADTDTDADADTDTDTDTDTDFEDQDSDGVADSDDDFPTDPTEWNDNDSDGTGDNADTDDDNDGLGDDEENDYGVDCAISNPLSPDGDNDGILDVNDPYPLDPFPEYLINSNNNGTFYFFLSNQDGTFQSQVEWMATNISDNYRAFAIADFDDDGRTDFIAHNATANSSGLYDMYFFYRTIKEDEFVQEYVGTTDLRASGIVADVNNDNLFDIITRVKSPSSGYVSSITGYVFLNNGSIKTAGCAVADYPDTSCAFTKRQAYYLGSGSVADGVWGFVTGRQAIDITNDGNKDIVVFTYPNGGNSAVTAYRMDGVGDGTFGTPVSIFTHNATSSQGPANSMVFTDFTNDGIGDVAMGLDDDGDAGSMWLYQGTGSGLFSSSYTEIFDINTSCESSCSDACPGSAGSARTYDFDFDGNMDIILGYTTGSYSSGPSKIEVRLGDGTGGFASPIQVGPTLSNTLGNSFEIPQRLCPWYVP